MENRYTTEEADRLAVEGAKKEVYDDHKLYPCCRGQEMVFNWTDDNGKGLGSARMDEESHNMSVSVKTNPPKDGDISLLSPATNSSNAGFLVLLQY